MKGNAPLKDDFFDPASLALDEEENESAAAEPVALVKNSDIATEPVLQSFGEITPSQVENLEEPHRFQGEFQDPLLELSLRPLASGIESAVGNTNASGNSGNSGNSETDLANRNQMAAQLFAMVLGEQNFSDLCRSSLGTIVHALGAERGALFEIDRARGEFFFRASSGMQAMEEKKAGALRFPRNFGFVGDVAERRVAEVVNDARSDARFQKAIGGMLGAKVRSAMAAPIIIGGELFGVVEVLNAHDEKKFSDFDLATLEMGATMMAKILEVRFLTSLLRKHG